MDISISQLALLAGIALILIVFLFGSFFIVEQQTVKIVERLGKFKKVAHSGFNFKIPLIEYIASELSLRIQQLDICIETKTKDNVFIRITICVQYNVLPDKIFDACYKLTNPKTQIESFVFDAIRAEAPKMNLDAIFENKDHIATAVKNELTGVMADFGFNILKSLVTNIDPDENVKHAMNLINEKQRIRMAASEQGEADKILLVKKAEAEAESMALQGKGIANQRKAIIEGLKQSIEEFKETIPGATALDVMNLVMMTQYYDTLKEIGAHNKSSTILLPHSPGGIKDISSQLREGIITGELSAQANR